MKSFSHKDGTDDDLAHVSGLIVIVGNGLLDCKKLCFSLAPGESGLSVEVPSARWLTLEQSKSLQAL